MGKRKQDKIAREAAMRSRYYFRAVVGQYYPPAHGFRRLTPVPLNVTLVVKDADEQA